MCHPPWKCYQKLRGEISGVELPQNLSLDCAETVTAQCRANFLSVTGNTKQVRETCCQVWAETQQRQNLHKLTTPAYVCSCQYLCVLCVKEICKEQKSKIKIMFFYTTEMQTTWVLQCSLAAFKRDGFSVFLLQPERRLKQFQWDGWFGYGPGKLYWETDK